MPAASSGTEGGAPRNAAAALVAGRIRSGERKRVPSPGPAGGTGPIGGNLPRVGMFLRLSEDRPARRGRPPRSDGRGDSQHPFRFDARNVARGQVIGQHSFKNRLPEKGGATGG